MICKKFSFIFLLLFPPLFLTKIIFPNVLKIGNKSAFQEKVIQNRKPVIVKFYAEWCGACQMIKQPFIELSELPEYKHVTFVDLDVDDNKVLSEEYEIQAMPTFIYFQGGEVKEKERGAHPNFKDHMKEKISLNFPENNNNNNNNIETNDHAPLETAPPQEEQAPIEKKGFLQTILAFIMGIFKAIKDLMVSVLNQIVSLFKTT